MCASNKGEQNSPAPAEPNRSSWLPLLLIALAVIAIQVLGGVLIYRSFSTWSDRGTFGDMFGAVNALFSGLAFAGVIYAIFLQRQELALQRDELAATRVELGRSAEAQEKSEVALGDQARILRQSAEAQQRSGTYSAMSVLISFYNDRIGALHREIDALQPKNGERFFGDELGKRREAIEHKRAQLEESNQKRDELVARLTELYGRDDTQGEAASQDSS